MKTSSFILALATGSIGLLLNACAGIPATPLAAQQAAVTQPPPVKTCQTDYATGSHYQQHTVCQSDDEESETHQQTDQTLSTFRQLSDTFKKPPGKGGGI